MSLRTILNKNTLWTLTRNVGLVQISSREGHTMRGKPPGVARTLEQRLSEEKYVDPELVERIDIGFPKLKLSRSKQLKERLAYLKAQRSNPELEKLAYTHKLLIDIDAVDREYKQTNGQYDLRLIADHYGIYADLFDLAFFVPRVPLDIKYQIDEETFCPVFNGNIIKPSEAINAPEVSFNGTADPISGKKIEGDSYWTLLLTNPDSHSNSDNESIHWFISNIPNGDVQKGDTIIQYLQPFPPKGIGYQRLVFVLYKQNKKLDFSSYEVNSEDPLHLEKRTFKTLDFYRKYQDDITPAGLAFYQCDWDISVKNFYHNVLNLQEPIYEYDFRKPYKSDQKFFPLKQPFNLYMDKHRDIKQINKEFLERKLANTHPFDGPKKPLRFPNAHPLRNMPSWLRTEKQKSRLGMGRINDYK